LVNVDSGATVFENVDLDGTLKDHHTDGRRNDRRTRKGR
jgi:hypothetical protein